MAINKYSDGRTYHGKQSKYDDPDKVPEKKSKYGNIKTELDGIKFDSKKEAAHYRILSQLLKAGYIKSFTMQVEYILQEKFRNQLGKMNRAIKYKSDFDVIDLDDNLYSLDSKGMETEIFRIKKKLFERKFDRPIYMIKKDSRLQELFIKE